MADETVEGRDMISLVVIFAIALAIVLALASTFTNTTVSSNFTAGAQQASSLTGVILFVAAAAIALKLLRKL